MTGGDAIDLEPPDDLWHVVLFFHTGEIIRRALAQDGAPEYRPLVYDIFERGVWTEFRDPIEKAWRGYLDGERTLPEAAAGLLRSLKETGSKEAAANARAF